MNTDDFKQLIWDFYKNNGRHDLPWRLTDNPYAIYISEIMLQQTQAPRVIEKYKSWLADFPSFQAVADASKKQILSHWQGLGYNRRALHIKETAEIVTERYNGKLPNDEDKLLELPGIGPYTAGALQAFIFGKPVVFVETNIRTVFIHHFLPEKNSVSDVEIKKLVAESLPKESNQGLPVGNDTLPIREWYWALMDYGAHLKKTVGNLNKKSTSYQKQSKFAGSNRQLRAELTRFILNNEPVTLADIQSAFYDMVNASDRMKSLKANLHTLQEEGFVTYKNNQYKTSD